jgi:putative phage-type endonuclease
MRKIVQLVQGTQEWHTHRAKHFNASEASAMLGLSPYQSRSDLLKAKSTGITPEVDVAKQRLFDAGHAAEAAARPEAKRVIGKDLYPITATRDVGGLHLSASYDGATMEEDIVWEHKLLNVALADSLSRGIIPEQYHPQLEQQLLVIEAEKALFMATSSDKTAMEYVWYTSNPEMRQRLIAGWQQFAIDLASYIPSTVEVIKPIGRTPETLPALHIEVTGMVTASNLAQYKEHALAVFGGINRDLQTDAQFADAEKTVKWCKDVEDRLAAAKQHALSQTASIDQLFKAIDDISAESRRTRLELDKLVTARKEALRGEIVAEGVNALRSHIAILNTRIGKAFMPSIHADFGGAIKGKRSLESIRDAVGNELARAKIESNALADRIQINLNTLNKVPDYAFLFADIAQLVLKATDDLEAVIQNRISAHNEKESARIEADRARFAEQERAKAEASVKARADAEAAAASPAPQVQSASVADDCARVERIVTAPDIAPAVTHEAVAALMPATVRNAMKPKADAAPTLALGEISTRLGFNCTSAFLATIGFEATTVKAAKLYQSDDFKLICQALIIHIAEVQDQFEAATA